jgi:uncharacterized membrane protein SirB2
MSYEFYKVAHLAGIMILFMSMGGILLNGLQGNGRVWPHRSWMMAFHGIGLTIVFITGFGLIAKSGVATPWPGWLWGKLLIWLLLATITIFIQKIPHMAKVFWFAVWILGGCAAYLAVVK